VHQFLVVLSGTDPLVWRRIQVPQKYSFWDLHVAIQDAMGWLDYHLHEFRLLDAAELACGAALALGLAHAARTLSFGVSPFDASTYVLLGVGLLFVTTVATYIPARRAATVDP
jgi:hypothetical protein